MRPFILSVLLYLSVGYASAQADIRHVDFKNFSYPWFHAFGWSDKLKWLDMSHEKQVRLANGRRVPDPGNYGSFEGLTLEEVQYAGVTGEGQTDAIVVLRYDTGGTQLYYYVYIYALEGGKPKLLACFQSGDRASSGLSRVYGQNGKLIVELFDPKMSEGDCCSSGIVRTRYVWRNGRFLAVGAKEFGVPTTASRVPVDVFGNHP